MIGAVLAVPVRAWASDQSQPLHGLQYWEDPQGQATLGDVLWLDPARWTPTGQGAPNFGYSSSVWWFEARLPRAHSLRWLEFAAPVLDQLDIWLLDERNSVIAHHQLGDTQPFAERLIAHRNFLVPVLASPLGDLGATRMVVRLQTASSVQLPVSVWEPAAFQAADQGHVLLFGLYFGLMIGMLAYNFLLFLSVRERTFIWYVSWVASITLFQLTLNGLAYQYLWPEQIRWNEMALPVLLSVAVFCAAQFMTVYLDLDRRGGRLLWLARIISGGAALMAILSLWLDYGTAIRGAIGVAVPGILVALLSSGLMWRQGDLAARYFLIGWSCVLLGGIVLAASKFGYLPRVWLTEYATQIGTAVEVVLLSLAMAERLNNERKMREQAQAELIASQREVNEQLERRVAERTEELEALNHQLAEVSRRDGLTGLFNRRHFDRVFEQHVLRAAQSGAMLGVILIDLDHFKAINDVHGHQAGDLCLQRAAASVQRSIGRQGDLVARYGGEEFVALLPNATPQGCWIVAERLRQNLASFDVPVGDGCLRMSASVGASCLVPTWPSGARDLLRQADDALYAAKRAGRNRTVMAELEPAPQVA